ncbi:MAG: small multi-drug export protein [Oscillospiraceae bacterium]|nr:small multi-drug export protein [Oscillospiraceae bacterium]
MLPVLELRGAIPVGISLGLGFRETIIISVIGNLLPVPFIILFTRRLFAFLRHRLPKLEGLVSRLEKKAKAKEHLVRKWQLWGLVVLVAIPLPGTGAWTGALVAAVLDLRLKSAFPAIALGVAIAAVIVTALTFGFKSLLI